jgi:hypothetical protein
MKIATIKYTDTRLDTLIEISSPSMRILLPATYLPSLLKVLTDGIFQRDAGKYDTPDIMEQHLDLVDRLSEMRRQLLGDTTPRTDVFSKAELREAEHTILGAIQMCSTMLPIDPRFKKLGAKQEKHRSSSLRTRKVQ